VSRRDVSPMTLSSSAHAAQPWHIHELTPDFRLEDVLAILVKRNGLLGTAYMAAIRPFRHLIVYPSMMRRIERAWRAG
jgi:Protein of unknown function (DUF2867)